MTDLRPAVATLVVVAVAFAGCIGGSSSASDDVAPGEDGETAEDPGTADGDPPDAAGETLRFDAEAVDRTFWSNGTFQPQEACLPAGCVQGFATGEYPGRAVIELTPDLPPGVPVRVQAEATYDSTFTGDMFLWLDGDGYRTYDLSTDGEGEYDAGTSEATATLDGTVVREDGGSVDLILSYSVADVSASVDYSLRADLRADPGTVPGNVPVAFPVEDPSEPITLRPVAAEQGTSATIWGPDDGTIAKVDLSGSQQIELPEDASAGEHVLLADDHPGVVVSAPGDGMLRALATETTYAAATSTPAHAGPATGQVTWSFEVPTAPVAVGIAVEPSSNADGVVFSGASGTITSPEGQVLSFEGVGTYITTGHAWTSDLGGSALVDGTYEASFSADAAANVEVGQVVVEYVR